MPSVLSPGTFTHAHSGFAHVHTTFQNLLSGPVEPGACDEILITGVVLPQVYLTTLEMVKATCRRFCERAQLTAAQTATVSNGVGGAVASLATQSVIVPIDVVRPGRQPGVSPNSRMTVSSTLVLAMASALVISASHLATGVGEPVTNAVFN